MSYAEELRPVFQLSPAQAMQKAVHAVDTLREQAIELRRINVGLVEQVREYETARPELAKHLKRIQTLRDEVKRLEDENAKLRSWSVGP